MKTLLWRLALVATLAMLTPGATQAAPSDSDSSDMIFWGDLSSGAPRLLYHRNSQGRVEFWAETEGGACSLRHYSDRWKVTAPLTLYRDRKNNTEQIGTLFLGDIVEQHGRDGNWRLLQPLKSGWSEGWAFSKESGSNPAKLTNLELLPGALRIIDNANNNPQFRTGELVRVVSGEVRRGITFRQVEHTTGQSPPPANSWIAQNGLAEFKGYFVDCMQGNGARLPPNDAKPLQPVSLPKNMTSLLAMLPIESRLEENALQSAKRASTDIGQSATASTWELQVRNIPNGASLDVEARGCKKKGAGGSVLTCTGPLPDTMTISYSGILKAESVSVTLEKAEGGATVDFDTLTGHVNVVLGRQQLPPEGLLIGGNTITRSDSKIMLSGSALRKPRSLSVSLPKAPACSDIPDTAVDAAGLRLEEIRINCARIGFPAPFMALISTPHHCTAQEDQLHFLCPSTERVTFSPSAAWEKVTIEPKQMAAHDRDIIATVEIPLAELRLKVGEQIRKIEAARPACQSTPSALTVTGVSFAEGEKCPPSSSREVSLAGWSGTGLPQQVCWWVRREEGQSSSSIPMRAPLSRDVERTELEQMLETTYPVDIRWSLPYRSSQNFDLYASLSACRSGAKPLQRRYFEESAVKSLRSSTCGAARVTQGSDNISECAQAELEEDKVVFKPVPLLGLIKPNLVVIDGYGLPNTAMVYDAIRESATTLRERVADRQAMGIDLALARGDGTITSLIKASEWATLPETAKNGQDSINQRLNKIGFNTGSGRAASVVRNINTQYNGNVSSIIIITSRYPTEEDGIEDLAMLSGIKKYYDINVISTESSCRHWTAKVEIQCQTLSKATIVGQLKRLGMQ